MSQDGSVTPDADSPDTYPLGFDEQIRVFLDEHRHGLAATLEGLTEAQARQRLVPSDTTLLGLVKHCIFVERVWFEEAFTGLPRDVLGLASGPDESFQLDDDDTIASTLDAYRDACGRSVDVVEGLSGDHVVTGNRRGPLPLRWIMLHVLRETAQHCGHAEILREQILAANSGA